MVPEKNGRKTLTSSLIIAFFHDCELEKLVLGLCIMNPMILALVMQIISPSDLYSLKNALILGELGTMAAQNKSRDLPLLYRHLDERGMLEDCGGAAYLASLLDGVPRSEINHIENYCLKLRELSLLRKIQKHCLKIAEAKNAIDLAEILSELHAAIDEYIDQQRKEATNGRRADDAGTSL